LEVFAGFWVVFSKLALVFEETTGRFKKVTARLCDFVGSFSNSFPWNFIFFPWNFENVRRNLENVGRNCRKMPKV